MSRKFERRAVPEPFTVREVGDGVSLSGYAAVYNQVAHGEVIRSGAFDKSVSENPNVSLLANHGGIAMARTINYRGLAPTLRLDVDKKGLHIDTDPLDVEGNATAREIDSSIARGDTGEMSFAFWPIIESANDEGVRELFEVGIDGGDVSVVTNAWYDQTSVELNALDGALLCLRSGRALTPEQRAAVTEWVDSTLREEDPEPLIFGTAVEVLGSLGIRVEPGEAEDRKKPEDSAPEVIEPRGMSLTLARALCAA